MDTRCFKLHRSYLISLWAKPKRPYLSLEKEKENFCEIRKFHVAVVQQRLRNALRSVMHVQSCSFANLNLLLFCCSPSPLHKLSTERFQMTSGRPYRCSKTIKRRPCWCCKPILWELNSFLM